MVTTVFGVLNICNKLFSPLIKIIIYVSKILEDGKINCFNFAKLFSIFSWLTESSSFVSWFVSVRRRFISISCIDSIAEKVGSYLGKIIAYYSLWIK